MSDQNEELIHSRQQLNRQQNERQMRGTLETVKLEQQRAPLPRWQQYIVNALALVGALAILYLIVTAVF